MQPQGDIDLRAHVPALEGVHGRIRVREGEGDGEVVYVLSIADGDVEFRPGTGQADCELTCLQEGDIGRIARGELNLLTAALQGRVRAEGDASLLLRTTGPLLAYLRARGSEQGRNPS